MNLVEGDETMRSAWRSKAEDAAKAATKSSRAIDRVRALVRRPLGPKNDDDGVRAAPK